MSRLRPQYHFRPSANGFSAWDVSKLINSLDKASVVDFPVEQIAEVDELWWYQEGCDVPTPRSVLEHSRRIMNVELDWPILLDPNHRLIDGMHRVLKSIYEERKHIKACILDEMPEPDFIDVMPDQLSY